MKFALCLSGNLRTFNDVFQHMKTTILDHLDCDVFIHTWDSIGSQSEKNGGDIEYNKKAIKSTKYLQFLRDTYKPKKILIEPDKSHTFIGMTNHINVPEDQKIFVVKHLGYHVSMFYSIFMSNQIRKQYENSSGIKYDRIIRCRPDIRFGTVFNENMFNDPNKLYLPIIGTYCNNGLNDQVAIGSNNVIDVYSNLYNNIVKYLEDKVTTMRPESLIKYHLDKNYVNYERINIDYDIYRLNGEILRQYELHCETLGVKWK